jgi:hypothetical protein
MIYLISVVDRKSMDFFMILRKACTSKVKKQMKEEKKVKTKNYTSDRQSENGKNYKIQDRVYRNPRFFVLIGGWLA